MLAEQLVAVLATGNVAVLADSPANRQLAATLGSHVELTQDVLTASLDAVLYEGNDAAKARQQLAQRDGALIPLVLAGKDGYNLHRLVVERAVSVNTTAAGGNASLMSIGD
jgi:RHH-type proline utilization regulon transcriptional repressor/proline dehydrogenase/delta 1-pyrroline-5-carboxylate dehydrogenase